SQTSLIPSCRWTSLTLNARHSTALQTHTHTHAHTHTHTHTHRPPHNTHTHTHTRPHTRTHTHTHTHTRTQPPLAVGCVGRCQMPESGDQGHLSSRGLHYLPRPAQRTP